MSLPKKYIPSEHEKRIRKKWAESRVFHADPSRVDRDAEPNHEPGAKRPPYTVLIPPPNVTARLHLGHALNNTLQDILVRAHRMKGYETLWMPGTDHAGIATQTVVDKRLKEAGEPALADYKKQELQDATGRDAFIAKVQAWKDEYEQAITDQLVEMGCSCDWERQRFTMDEICARAVREAFFRLFKTGLIYRGKRLVNWDPISQTALADDEVDMIEVDGIFAYMRYPLCDADGNAVTTPSSTDHITVATTRPETYMGDTGVAVNPDDPRAAELKDLFVKLPLVGRVIPIVQDDYVVLPNPESSDSKAKMATGFLKVTPAHDPNDEQIGLRHDLPAINIMAPDASISDQHGWEDVGEASMFVGMSREDARKAVLDEFKKRDLLEKVVPYRHSVGHSYRSHAAIEPYLSDQWYCKVTDDRLRGEAQRALTIDQRTEESLSNWPESNPNSNNEPRPSGSGPTTPTSYLITFTTYGTWLHGDARGSVSADQNLPGEPHLPKNSNLHETEAHQQTSDTFELNTNAERAAVASAIAEVCQHRGWALHACNVRTNHVHTVVIAKDTPERVMNDFKSYATRALRQRAATVRERSDSVNTYDKVWTRHGSTRYLNTETSFHAAIKYALDEQGEDLGGRLTREDAAHSQGPLPDSRGSLLENADASMSFHPARYAKTYETWHDNLKDWCISRQLWWGHRIPVWSRTQKTAGWGKEFLLDQGDRYPADLELDGCSCSGTYYCEGDMLTECVCFESEPTGSVLESLKEAGFTQDPDVLDTWFSSALWPLSTLGWPRQDAPSITPAQIDPEIASRTTAVWTKRVGTWKDFIGNEGEPSAELIDHLLPLRDHHKKNGGLPVFTYQLFSASNPSTPLTAPDDIQSATDLVCAVAITEDTPSETIDVLKRHNFLPADTADLLDAFNPTSVLATAREIITLWVSRMVMFQRFFLGEDTNKQRAATVRERSDNVNEHSTPPPFNDVFIHAMIQDGEGRKMSKSLGNGVDPVDIIHTHGTDALRFTLCDMTTQTQDVRMPVEPDPATGRNTSPKFDLGRNFTSKLYSAASFAMMQMASASNPTSVSEVALQDLTLPDRWILTRLAKNIEKVDREIASYQFSSIAESLYDLMWRDFCDWYIEAIKPTVKDSPTQQAVLHNVLETILRLLHPITPFVTEVIGEALPESDRAAIQDLELDRRGDLMCLAPWPSAGTKLQDDQALALFERLQAFTTLIRETRAQQKVAAKRKITLHAPQEVRDLLAEAPGMVEFLAGLAKIEDQANIDESSSIQIRFEGHSLSLSDLADAVDASTQLAALKDQATALEKDTTALEKRLSNKGYTEKAPAHLVEETRTQLTTKQSELAIIRQRIKDLE